MNETNQLEECLIAYSSDLQPQDVEALGTAGGFSGARFWQLQTPQGRLCLRCWPAEHPDRPQLRFIHDVLDHVAAKDVVPLPVPIRTTEGETFVEAAGRRWQLEPWMPGEADYRRKPTAARLAAAMRTLARFHLAVEDFELGDSPTRRSQGISSRANKIREWTDVRIAKLLHEIQSERRAELGPVVACVREVVTLYGAAAPRVLRSLAAVEQHDLAVLPCIRDIHDQHVLFEDDRVTGLIDFGSMRVDHATCDVARLLGSLVADETGPRQDALAAYEELRPLTMNDRVLVRVWDRSTTLLSGMNWLEWIFLDRREFADYDTITSRLVKICDRLRVLASQC